MLGPTAGRISAVSRSIQGAPTPEQAGLLKSLSSRMVAAGRTNTAIIVAALLFMSAARYLYI